MSRRPTLWVVDGDAVEEAAYDLDLRLPVRVRRVGNCVNFHGSYELRFDRRYGGLYHWVGVSSRTPIPNETLWHELAHAVQAERDLGHVALAHALDDPTTLTMEMRAGMRRRVERVRGENARYRRHADKPCEQEADALEARAVDWPLTKPTRAALAAAA